MYSANFQFTKSNDLMRFPAPIYVQKDLRLFKKVIKKQGLKKAEFKQLSPPEIAAIEENYKLIFAN